MGTTGESVTLSQEERNAALDCVKKANNNRLPIVLGIGGNNTDYIIQSFSSYNLDGIDAILLFHRLAISLLKREYTSISKRFLKVRHYQ